MRLVSFYNIPLYQVYLNSSQSIIQPHLISRYFRIVLCEILIWFWLFGPHHYIPQHQGLDVLIINEIFRFFGSQWTHGGSNDKEDPSFAIMR